MITVEKFISFDFIEEISELLDIEFVIGDCVTGEDINNYRKYYFKDEDDIILEYNYGIITLSSQDGDPITIPNDKNFLKNLKIEFNKMFL